MWTDLNQIFTVNRLWANLFFSGHVSQMNKRISLSPVQFPFFPDGPQLADIRMSPFWIYCSWMTEVVVTTGAIRHAKLQ